MSIGDLVLFFHLLGVICVFVGFGTLLLATAALARASSVEQVRAITGPLLAGRRLGREQISLIDVIVMAGVLLIAITGVALARANDYVWSSWVVVATATFLLMAPIGPLLINPRLHSIAGAARQQAEGPLTVALGLQIHDPVLAVAMRSWIGGLVGLVLLMTTKPGLALSIAAILASLALGAASSFLFRKT